MTRHCIVCGVVLSDEEEELCDECFFDDVDDDDYDEEEFEDVDDWD